MKAGLRIRFLKFGMLLFLFQQFSLSITATSQEPDWMIYHGKKWMLDCQGSSPLVLYYLKAKKVYPRYTLFKIKSANNRRGHEATWEIIDNTLYLTSVAVDVTSASEPFKRIKKGVDLRKLFLAQVSNGRVRADWFTGVVELRRETGRIVKFEDLNRYIHYVFLDIEKGQIKKAYPMSRKILMESDPYLTETKSNKNPEAQKILQKYYQFRKEYARLFPLNRPEVFDINQVINDVNYVNDGEFYLKRNLSINKGDFENLADQIKNILVRDFNIHGQWGPPKDIIPEIHTYFRKGKSSTIYVFYFAQESWNSWSHKRKASFRDGVLTLRKPIMGAYPDHIFKHYYLVTTSEGIRFASQGNIRLFLKKKGRFQTRYLLKKLQKKQ